MALVDMSVVEQRYRAVLAVQRGEPKNEVAAHFGVSRQTLHSWLARYTRDGLAGLTDRSHRPESCPHQASAEVEAAVCELRREHPRWGPLRLVHELGRVGQVCPVPSRMSVHRILVRHGLITPRARRRKRSDYVRWQRPEPMQLWQLDIVGGVWIDDGHGGTFEAKVVTGVDDCSRFCVMAAVVVRATGRAVCLAFAAGLRHYGIPDEVLTDNGKQFTARFGRGGEVLFDRICRDNAIVHRLTEPSSPTTHREDRAVPRHLPPGVPRLRRTLRLGGGRAGCGGHLGHRLQLRPAASGPGHGLPGRPVRPQPGGTRAG
jgi:transposase